MCSAGPRAGAGARASRGRVDGGAAADASGSRRREVVAGDQHARPRAQIAIPSAVCPPVGCSSSSASPSSQRPGTGSAWTAPSASGRRALEIELLVEGAQLALGGAGLGRRRAALLSAQPSARPGRRAARAGDPSRRAWRAGRWARRKPACSSSDGQHRELVGEDRRVDHERLARPVCVGLELAARLRDARPRRITQLTCSSALVTTITSGCSEIARTPGLRRRRAAWRPLCRLCTSAVGFFCEDSSVSLLRLTQITGNALFHAGHDVVVVAGGDVDPAALAAHAPRALGEVGRLGLVGADLLGGDDEVEVDRDVAARLPEQLVVDVREQAELVLLGQLLQLRVGLLEGLPALHRVGQEARARGLERPLEAFGDLDRRAAQHLGVELVGAALDFARDLVEQRDQRRCGRSRSRRGRPPWRTPRRSRSPSRSGCRRRRM